MADIAMCMNNLACPSRDKCYRATAPRGMRQSLCDFKVPEGEDKCKHFWDNKGYTKDESYVSIEKGGG